jgi:hypothetical protein
MKQLVASIHFLMSQRGRGSQPELLSKMSQKLGRDTMNFSFKPKEGVYFAWGSLWHCSRELELDRNGRGRASADYKVCVSANNQQSYQQAI